MEHAIGNVSVIGRSFDLTTETRQYIVRRIAERIGRFQGIVRKVDVRITDVNGDKGGIDKDCSLVATLEGGGSLVARTRATTVHGALARAIRIIGRNIATTLDKNRWKRPRRRAS